MLTVTTNIIGTIGFEVQAQSTMAVSGVRRQKAAAVFSAQSSMAVNARLKWVAEPDTSETWAAIGDTSETWTPIADNSETWQIAA